LSFSISAFEISKKVSWLVRRANFFLPLSVYQALSQAQQTEDSKTATTILGILLDNARFAQQETIPICQDTGIDVVFVEIGQDLIIDGDLKKAINEGVARGTAEGFLRASVCDPLTRQNSGDNTPAVIHVDIVEGTGLKIAIVPKGCGSENMSQLKMLPPSAGLDGIMDFVVQCVESAGPNSCPPGIVGVGIGGTMEMATLLAKKALLRPIGQGNSNSLLDEVEKRLLDRLNRLGIGPHGLGGTTTALSVAIESYPCHIASLPVAVNIQCHAARQAMAVWEKGEWIEDKGIHQFADDDSSKDLALMNDAVPLKLPLDRTKVSILRAGQWVRLSGRLLTGRDRTHKRLCELIRRKQPLPVNLAGQLIYYVGPSPAPPGHVVGAAGPTTSYRMDAYTPDILDQGVLGLMGKGKRSIEVRQAIKDHGAVYLATIGGAGAYLSRAIKSARVIAFDDLGPEAMYEFVVEDFPAVVINDGLGQDYYEIVLEKK